MSNSEAVSSTHHNIVRSHLQSLDQLPSNPFPSSKPNVGRNLSGAFKPITKLEHHEIKHPNREQFTSMLSTMDHVRSFHSNQDQAGVARSNPSSVEILCQIFPGRSRNSLESLLKVSVTRENLNDSEFLR